MSASKTAVLIVIGALAAQTLVAQVPKTPRGAGPSLEGLNRLEGLKALQGLDALKGLEGLSALSIAPTGAMDLDLDALPQQQGPADSLYRSAREQLNAGSYQRAAELFQRVVERYPRSVAAGDAMYWEAFAHYQNADYQRALDLINRQADRYPNARTRRDARVLAARIRGELARQGNPEAAESVFVAAAPPAAPSPAMTPPAGAPPAVATAPAAPAPVAAPSRRIRPSAAQVPGCEDQDSELRLAALNALLQMDADRAMPILKQVLERRDPCSVELRRKAVFLVSQKGGAEGSDVEDVLLHAAQSDPDREVRAQAIFWLSQVNTDRAVTALDSVLMGSTDREIQEKAIFALSQHGSARAGEILRRFIDRDDAPDDLKANAIFWLGQEHGGENIGYLKEIYPRLKSQELKEKVIFSISQNDDASSRQWLMDLALNGNEPMEMRKKALFWAGQKGDVAIGDLAKLYSSMADREMKEQLIFAYSQRHEPGAVDQLMAIAEKEPDPELRKKAIFWLGQSDDPRAAEFLLRIINK
jgi:TolA-binding protein